MAAHRETFMSAAIAEHRKKAKAEAAQQTQTKSNAVNALRYARRRSPMVQFLRKPVNW